MRVRTQRPRARRYDFTANIELTDVQTEDQSKERMTDVSLYGCRVVTSRPISTGTKLMVRITHKGETFAALGTMAYAGRNGEMGIGFTNVGPKDQEILEKWVAELRNGLSQQISD
jgi:PilZ domain